MLDALADDCAADGRYTFLLSASPEPFVNAVGSLVNPVAIKRGAPAQAFLASSGVLERPPRCQVHGCLQLGDHLIGSVPELEVAEAADDEAGGRELLSWRSSASASMRAVWCSSLSI